MNEAQIYADLEELIEGILSLDHVSLTPETSASDIEGWDSFTHINILVAVEQKYGVRFTTQEVEAVQTVGDLVRLVELHS